VHRARSAKNPRALKLNNARGFFALTTLIELGARAFRQGMRRPANHFFPVNSKNKKAGFFSKNLVRPASEFFHTISSPGIL
jgi:hypothetical protein